MSNTKIVTREEKLKTIGLPIDYKSDKVNDESITEIYNKIMEMNNPQKLKGIISTKTSKYEKVNDQSDTYKITLTFLNDLLKVFNKQEITKITDFKEINRNDLTNPKCDEILNAHLPIIINHFGKTKIRHNEKNDHKCYILSVIKYLTMYCGYNFVSNRTQKLTKKQKCDYTLSGMIYYHII